MPTPYKRAKDFFKWIKGEAARLSAYVPIADSHVQSDTGESAVNVPFEADRHYFRAMISEMFLSESRRWFSEYNPLVYSAVEFSYGTRQEEEPKVVGPSLIGQNAPQETLYLNTPVCGLHPFRGGDITFTAILYRGRFSDHVRDLVAMVERVVGAVNPSVALAGYVGIANVIVDGLDMILGTKQTEPVIGLHTTFGTGNPFKPGYHALINSDASSVDSEKLWVRGGRLYVGDSMEESVPYQKNDFVLFQFMQVDDRDDLSLLSFYPLWQEVQKQAVDPKKWDEAKNTFAAMYRGLLLSDDLTEDQKERLRVSYTGRLTTMRKTARDQARLGGQTIPDKPSAMHDKLTELDDLFKDLD